MLRSLLFAPASNRARMEKALAGPSDAVIFDLEDAVAVDEKAAARRGLVEFLQISRSNASRSKPVYVRVNGLGTPFCFQDLVEICPAGPDGIVLPKAEAASDILTADWVISQVEAACGVEAGRIELLPIIETARGIQAAAAIAAASKRVRRMMYGAVDLALDMNLDLDDEAGSMAQARFAVALASRAAGLAGPVDTAFVAIRELDRLRESAINARRMGYESKSCIHPTQVEVVNGVFTPSEAEVERARRIVAAFESAEASGAAALKLDGMMIDYPVVDKARRLIAAASAAPV